MASIQNSYTPEYFHVVHPLQDEPEAKCSTVGLGRIAMTRGVRISLTLLRGYLLVMFAMLLYHVLDLAGVLNRVR
jgi:hypothetical protein